MARSKDAPAPKTLTPAVFHILLALSEGPLHGYAVSQGVEAASEGRVRMGPGTLYGSIQRMQQSGLVAECDPPDDGGPHAERRRYYELTEAGADALRSEAMRIEKLTGLAAFRSVLGRR